MPCATRLGKKVSQFLEVPDVKKHRLALSEIVLNGSPPKISENDSTEQKDHAAANSGSPAVRVFRQGETITYKFLIIPDL